MLGEMDRPSWNKCFPEYADASMIYLATTLVWRLKGTKKNHWNAR